MHPKMHFPLHLCCLCLHCEYLSPLICGVLLSEKQLEDTIRWEDSPWDRLASWFTHFTESCCDEGLIAFDSLRVAEKLVIWRGSCCGSASFQTKGWVAMLSKVCRQGLWRNATRQVWREGAIVWDLGLWAPGFLIKFISVLYPHESSARAQNGITSNITPKGYQYWTFIGFSTWRRTDSLEKTLMLGKIEGRRRRGWQRMRLLDGITTTMDMSLSNSGSWWWTGKPGVLQPMGLQRVRHDWVAELNWTDLLQNRRVITNMKRKFWNGNRRFDRKEDLKKGKVRPEEKE